MGQQIPAVPEVLMYLTGVTRTVWEITIQKMNTMTIKRRIGQGHRTPILTMMADTYALPHLLVVHTASMTFVLILPHVTTTGIPVKRCLMKVDLVNVVRHLRTKAPLIVAVKPLHTTCILVVVARLPRMTIVLVAVKRPRLMDLPVAVTKHSNTKKGAAVTVNHLRTMVLVNA